MKTAKVSRFEWVWCVAFVALAAVALNLLGAVLRPSHNDYGSTWSAYLAEPENSIDVLFMGSSYAYCDWNPGVVYDESGLTGYVMGGSEQTLGLTYYYLKEALKTQKPAVVVLEGTALHFAPYKSYTQINVGYMPAGLNKLGAILEYAEPEKRTELLFDLYVYHDRWKEVTREDWERAVTEGQRDHLKGYTAVDGIFVSETGKPAVTEVIPDEEQYRRNLGVFQRIAALCEENEIDLIVAMNPTYGQFSEEIYGKMRDDVLAAGAAGFVNWANAFDETGLDPTKHLFDGGHLNREGAAVFSRFTGRYLRGKGYEPRKQRGENEDAWRETAAYWREDGEK